MSRKETWIKIYRGIMESAVWEDNLRFKAWMYILLEASYADRSKYHRGNLIQLKRGDCFTTLRTMAKTVGCDPKTAKRILEQFRDDGMITFRTVPGMYTVIHVDKYRDFQGSSDAEVHTESHTESYTDDHTDDYTERNTESPYHKNIKKDKKERKEKDPAAPDGGPDGYGPKPDGWTDKDEEDFLMMYEDNDWKTRQAWWDYWKED